MRQAPEFRSFSCESYGGLHDDAAALIHDICVLAQERPTAFTAYEVKYGLSAASVACAIQRYNAAMILENIHQASKPAAATAPSYHAPNHQAIPLSSTPIVHRTFMHTSRIHPTHRSNSARLSAISDAIIVEPELSESSSVEFVPRLPVDNESVNVPASATSVVSDDAFIVRVVSVDDDARSVRSTAR